MVESGSTTTYNGNGLPFPNWICYNSSLFEVKVNGRPAIFKAAAPVADIDIEGQMEFNYLSGWSDSTVLTPQQGFNLFTNIDTDDGSVGEYPTISKDVYASSGSVAEPSALSLDPDAESELIPGIVNNKPIYLHNVDFSTMKGHVTNEWSINDFPQVICEELNLWIFYDPDYRRWRSYTGNPYFNILLEWRFKELVDIKNIPPFMAQYDMNRSYGYVYRDGYMIEGTSYIPNEVNPSLLEAHARAFIGVNFYNENSCVPTYQAKRLLGWPNIGQYLLDAAYTPKDPSVVTLPISSNANITNTVFRINGKPAWISENELPEDYDISGFSDYQFSPGSGWTGLEELEDFSAILEITDGTNLIRYDGATANWFIIQSDTEYLTVECLLLKSSDPANIPTVAPLVKFDMTAVYVALDTDVSTTFFAFKLLNPNLATKKLTSGYIPDLSYKYLNHEYVGLQTTPRTDVSYMPNYVMFSVNDYLLRINGVDVDPLITYGVNDAVTTVNYYIEELGINYIIDVGTMTSRFEIDNPIFERNATAPEGTTYFLDGARTDNLEINADTGLFNRAIPFVIQWVYKGSIDHNDKRPLFVAYYEQVIEDIEPSLIPGIGLYIDYYYYDTGKTASLTFAPNLCSTQDLNYQSLAMVHERDLFRGWKKSGFTGPKKSFNGYRVKPNTIGFPIIIVPEVEGPSELDVLPVTFVASNMAMEGEFDIVVNGNTIASANGNTFTDTINALDMGLVVTTTEEEIEPTYRSPSFTGDMVVEGNFDVIINGKTVLEDGDIDDLLAITGEEEVGIVVKDYLIPAPPMEMPS